jgi:hypothetical protein
MSDIDNLDNDTTPRCGRCLQPDDECECPHDADAPERCLHGLTVGELCAECQTLAIEQLEAEFIRRLDQIRQIEDETKGAALAARFEKRYHS